MDNHIENIIKKIAKESNVKEEVVSEVVKTYFNWQRDGMVNHTSKKFYLPYFGTFTLIDKKYQAWSNKKINITKTNITKNE